MRKLTRATKIIALLRCVIAVISVALATSLYTLTINMSMRLTATVGLELRDMAGNPITVYSWGDFASNSTNKLMTGDDVFLFNTGNGVATVQWSSTISADWKLWMQYNSSVTWLTGTNYTLPAGSNVDLRIYLKPMNANGGQLYNFALSFDQVA